MDIQNLTVEQFQELYAISKSEIEEEEKMTEIVACVSGKTAKEVDEMPFTEFKRLALEVKQALMNPVTDKTPKRQIGGYHILYEPGKLNRGQYVTFMHFAKGDVIDNCHYLLASITYDPKTKTHDSENFEQIAEDIKKAPMSDVYAACVFFCQLFNSSIQGLKKFFLRDFRKRGMTKYQSKLALEILMKDLDGFTMQNWLQILKA